MHFIARNDRYPQFSFNVPELRPVLDGKGRKMTSCLVHFEYGVLDTKAQGWSQKEAEIIRKRLNRIAETTVNLSFNNDNHEEPITVGVSHDKPPIQVKG